MNLRPLPPARRPKRPRMHWLARLMRGWRLDRNPLRRRSDRAETAVLGVLLAAFLAGRPVRRARGVELGLHLVGR